MSNKKRFLCEYRSTDDIKQKTENNSKQDHNRCKTIQIQCPSVPAERPKKAGWGGGGGGGLILLESSSHHILSLKPVSQSFLLLGARTKLLSLAEWS